MTDLSDKLKALGVQVGATGLHPAPAKRRTSTLDQILSGRELYTHHGATFSVEERLPVGSPHGRFTLEVKSSLEMLAFCLSQPSLSELPIDSFLFLDTETTGLSGGSGTFAFLIGAGRMIGDEFVTEQFFLRDPSEEPAQLQAFEEFLAPCQVIVTFNGKSFDIPVLQTRFLMQGWQPPFGSLIHIDLLHISRRLWRKRLPDRSLGNLEVQILDAVRTEEDVPGWLIPSLYSAYLLDADAKRLKPVFYHNKMDVISLVVLLDYIASLLNEPIAVANTFGTDLISTARLMESVGKLDTAANLYLQALQHEDAIQNRIPKEIILEALSGLAFISKRRADLAAAVLAWKQAAALGHLEAHIELAKYYEHQAKDLPAAIFWTDVALQLLEVSTDSSLPAPITHYARHRRREELLHRQKRLEKKIAKQ